MGTTLENGVYLPSEGERNCYAGLKTNWEILDQKVADVTALQQAVAGALHRQIVASLPTTDIDPNTIYMVLSGTSATENVYNEFMYVNNAWELIGTSATDLTNYYTKAEVDGKLLLKANASDLTSHTGDTTIHVTASDKTKWTNSANAVVFRYSSTALTASSTNSNALLDNVDNLKVGDKVIDSSGVLFSITAIDTQNSTFTIGTALIDLAQDSDVVHKSGDESVIGSKRFGVVQSFTGYPTIRLYNTNDDINVLPSYARQQDIRFTDKNDNIIAYFIFQHRSDANEPFRTCWRQVRLDGTSGYYSVNFNNLGEFYPENNNAIALGRTTNKWSDVQTYKVNALEPSSLSLPDIANKIDISSYITDLAGGLNNYTPPANGWISVQVDNSSVNNYIRCAYDVIMVKSSGNGQGSALSCLIPVIANTKVGIRAVCTTLAYAYFIPCQGNV